MQNDILKEHKLDALIVTNPYNILYLTGFKGISDTEREAILVVTMDSRFRGNDKGSVGMTLITAKLYQTEANKLSNKNLDVKIARERNEMRQMISTVLKGKQKVGFEETNLTVAELNNYKTQLPGKDLIATKNLIENIRVIKKDDEISKIEKAQIISQKALDSLLPIIEIGQTELELKYRLEAIMQELGSGGTSFESIVASGHNSGIPHHRTESRKIKKGDTLLFDFGAKYQNYCADLSRTVFVGRPSDRQINIYNHVKKAQEQALSKIQKEVKLKDAYNFAREVFVSSMLHDYFTHGLGHGIGLEVHEEPYLRSIAEDEKQIENGMVFSVEPGLYFSWGGVRIEDLVVIKNGKPKVLGKLAEGIIVL